MAHDYAQIHTPLTVCVPIYLTSAGVAAKTATLLLDQSVVTPVKSQRFDLKAKTIQVKQVALTVYKKGIII